jgi:hypothetical protein
MDATLGSNNSQVLSNQKYSHISKKPFLKLNLSNKIHLKFLLTAFRILCDAFFADYASLKLPNAQSMWCEMCCFYKKE